MGKFRAVYRGICCTLTESLEIAASTVKSEGLSKQCRARSTPFATHQAHYENMPIQIY